MAFNEFRQRESGRSLLHGLRRTNLRFTLDRLLLVTTVFASIALAIGYWVRFFRTNQENPMGAVLYTLAVPSFLLLAVTGAQYIFRFVQRRS